MRTIVPTLTFLMLLTPAFVVAADEKTKPDVPIAKTGKLAATSAPEVTPEAEAQVMAFVEEHHPELGKVLEVLKPMDPAEYRKAIGEILQVSGSLAGLKIRNPKRYELALDAWKAKSRVELLAAQLAGSPGEELRSRLRTAIEAKLDVEIRRQRFELEQAELAAKRAREALDRLENHRDAVVEARFRALQPKKAAKAKKPAVAKTAPSPSSDPTTAPANPEREDRR